jgi:hypothetical protein
MRKIPLLISIFNYHLYPSKIYTFYAFIRWFFLCPYLMRILLCIYSMDFFMSILNANLIMHFNTLNPVRFLHILVVILWIYMHILEKNMHIHDAYFSSSEVQGKFKQINIVYTEGSPNLSADRTVPYRFPRGTVLVDREAYRTFLTVFRDFCLKARTLPRFKLYRSTV